MHRNNIYFQNNGKLLPIPKGMSYFQSLHIEMYFYDKFYCILAVSLFLYLHVLY